MMQIPLLGNAARVLSWSPWPQQKTLHTAGPDTTRLSPKANEVPGGTPLSFCEVSRSTDLFDISSVELTKQPLYFDDFFFFHLYGTFQDSFTLNSTIEVRIDCGSHCEEYGNPPGEMPGESFLFDYCEYSNIMQPTGGEKRNVTCPPEKGWALIETLAYIWPMFLRVPAWYNFTFDAKTSEGERIYCLTAEVCLRWEDEKRNEGYPEGPWTYCRWPR